MKTDKFVLVTGASSGIGREISILLSANYNVILCGRNLEKLAETEKACFTKNRSIIFQMDLFDISNIESSTSAFIKKNDLTVSNFVHSAGFMKMVPLKSLSIENLNQIFNINVMSSALLAKVLVKKKVNGSALNSIIFVSSNISNRGAKAMAAYGASKGAVDSLMRCLAVELAPKVRVNSILPGAVHTEMTEGIFANDEVVNRMKSSYPLGLGSSKDIANTVEFLISEKARWITGQQLTVDGGRTIDISG